MFIKNEKPEKLMVFKCVGFLIKLKTKKTEGYQTDPKRLILVPSQRKLLIILFKISVTFLGVIKFDVR